MRRFLFLLLLLPPHSFAQSIGIDTLAVSVADKFAAGQQVTLKFPVIKTNNKAVDSLINTDLKNRFTGNEYPDEPTDSTLVKCADDSITFLDFAVTYNQRGLLSLHINAEGCGANCTDWTEYYTYSTTTGKLLALEDVVDLEKLKPTIIRDANRQYEQQRKALRALLHDKNARVDTESYDAALEYYNTCSGSFKPETFALHDDCLEIISNCELPRFIRNLTPLIELKYKYRNIKRLLKI